MNPRTKWKALLFCTVIFTVLLFPVSVRASETDREYLCTLGPGDSYPVKDIVTGIYTISATSINSFDGWCTGCAGGSHLTYEKGAKVATSYDIYLDGIPIFSYNSIKKGSGEIDFTAYNHTDGMISLPKDYTVKQTVKCVGGTYTTGGSIEPCGYQRTETLRVTGSMQLYVRANQPKLLRNPVNAEGDTDGSASFDVRGEKVSAYRWQKYQGGGYENLADGKAANGVIYRGTNSPVLTLSSLRFSENGALFRCVLVGENGMELVSEPAFLAVKDVSPPLLKLTYTPTENTSGKVTIRIDASDPDSGLSENPYFYLGMQNAASSFSVGENGTYEVQVRDACGNRARSVLRINNIVPPALPTATPPPIETPTATPTQPPSISRPQPTALPTKPDQPASIVTPTPLPLSGKKQKTEVAQEMEEDETGEAEKKSVNISTLLPEEAGDVESKEELLAVEQLEMLAEAPMEFTEERNLNAGENRRKIDLILFLGAGILAAFALLICALIFVVRIDTADELGNWHFSCIRLLTYRQGWRLKVAELLEDYDRLRLHFGGLFLTIARDHEVLILCSQGEELLLEQLKDTMEISYHEARRREE